MVNIVFQRWIPLILAGVVVLKLELVYYQNGSVGFIIVIDNLEKMGQLTSVCFFQ